MKFAVVSAGLPPSQSGQSMVLYHLLKDLDPGAYCLLSQKNFNLYRLQGNCSETLAGSTHLFGPEYQAQRLHLRTASSLRLAGTAERMLARRAARIEAVVEREGCDLIVACTGHLLDPLAVHRVSQTTGIPYVLYVFDDLASTIVPPVLADLVAESVPKVIRDARRVVVPNEFLAEKYRTAFGVDPVVLHNPCDLSAYASPPPRPDSAGEARIVYTGAIYEAHFDAVRDLVEALDLLDRPGIRLHLYTTQSPARLAAHGIAGPVTVHAHQPVATMPAIQMGADLLFLPLGFRTPYAETIRTSAPGKVGEYLASSTPVLVHAPVDTFLSWYFRTHDCGLVADSPDPSALADGVEALLADGALRERLTLNALVRSREDFDARAVARRFRELVEQAAA